MTITGIDVLVRPETNIEVTEFDGRTIPFGDDAFDAVTFVDVLHHTDDATALLREAARVASTAVVIKDHLAEGFLAKPTLRAMDWVGNASFGVALPYNYWTTAEWHRAFDDGRAGDRARRSLPWGCTQPRCRGRAIVSCTWCGACVRPTAGPDEAADQPERAEGAADDDQALGQRGQAELARAADRCRSASSRTARR